MNTTQPEALQLAECCEHGYPLSDEAIRAATELRRLHAYCQELESQLAQRFDAADMATAAQAVVQDDDDAALVRAAQAFVLEPDSHKKKLGLEAMEWGPLAAATQPAPVLWLSPEQFANFVDADEAPFGKYVPARKTSAGKFTMPLFAARAPAPAQTADSQLLQFYGVTTDAELIAAQAAHIEKLQAKLTNTPSFAPQRVREG